MLPSSSRASSANRSATARFISKSALRGSALPALPPPRCVTRTTRTVASGTGSPRSTRRFSIRPNWFWCISAINQFCAAVSSRVLIVPLLFTERSQIEQTQPWNACRFEQSPLEKLLFEHFQLLDRQFPAVWFQIQIQFPLNLAQDLAACGCAQFCDQFLFYRDQSLFKFLQIEVQDIDLKRLQLKRKLAESRTAK